MLYPQAAMDNAYNGRAPAGSASARGGFWADERDELFLAMDLIGLVRHRKTHYQTLAQTHLRL
jgi:hypothetical protein